MKLYRTQFGNVIGRAYGRMQCKNTEPHEPHTHDPEYASYGPYICSGGQKIFVECECCGIVKEAK